jgi:uncharacterized protein
MDLLIEPAMIHKFKIEGRVLVAYKRALLEITDPLTEKIIDFLIKSKGTPDIIQGTVEELALLMSEDFSTLGIDVEAIKLTLSDLGETLFLAFDSEKSEEQSFKLSDEERTTSSFTIDLANDCNLSCRYCWNVHGLYREGGTPHLMTMETGERVVDFVKLEIKRHKVKSKRRTNVLLYGGEPLLNEKVLKYLVESLSPVVDDLVVNTNGVLLSLQIFNFLVENKVQVGVSFDGTPEVQNYQRPLRGGGNSYGIIVNNLLEIFASSSPNELSRLSFRSTLMPPYWKKEDVYEYFHRMFPKISVNSIECNWAINTSGVHDYGALFKEDPKRTKKAELDFIKWRLNKIQSGDPKNEHLPWFRDMLSFVFKPRGSCIGIFHSLHISSRGEIYPCYYTACNADNLGNIQENPGLFEHKIIVFRESLKISMMKAKHEQCVNCWGRDICGGVGCYGLNWLGTGDPLIRPKDWCRNELNRYELQRWLYAEMTEKYPDYLNKVRTVQGKLILNMG